MKEQGQLTDEQETELAELQPKAQQPQKKKVGNAKRYQAGKVAVDRVVELEALAEQGPLTEEQEAELAELQPKVAQQQKRKARDAERYQAGKVAVDRVVELEALAEQGPLTEEQEAELAELQPKVAQQQKRKARDAERYQARKVAVARVVELEALKEQGPLTEEQEAELAELQPKAQQKQKQKEGNAERYQARKVAVARVVELEALKEQGPLTEEQEAELAELQPKAQQKQKKKDYDAERHQAGKVAAARVVELEALKEQGPLTEEQEAELARLRRKAQQWQKKKEENVERHRARKVAAARVVELEALAERGPLTVEQEAELAELRPKAQQKAQQKQRQKESAAKYRRVGKVALDRVAELEGLEGLTEEQEVELAELQPKAQQWRQNRYWYRVGKAAAARVVELEALKEQGRLTEEQGVELEELRLKAQQWQKKKEGNADWYRVRKAAAARVVELEALKEQGRLTAEQGVELEELRLKAQQWQKKKEGNADWHRVRKAAADRVAELEGLEGLTVEQGVELAELRPKAQQWRKQKDWYRAGKAAVDRVAELEELEGLTVEQRVELAELRPKAQQWQKRKERLADWYRVRKAAVDRVAELEALEGEGRLTEEQEVELAQLRSKVAGRGRKKKALDVTEAGVGGALVADRGVGLEGVSGWAGADQDDWDGWSADVDLDAWFARAVADVDGVQVPQGATDAGVMLGADAYEEFVANGLAAFLGQDAGDDAAGAGGAGAVAGGFDFAGFLPDYTDWVGSVGLFGGEGPDGLFFGEPFAEDAVGPDAGDAAQSGALGVSDRIAGGESVGSGYRFLPGVNQANYGSGDERYQVNCQEAVVALFNSLKFGRQFVAGPVGGDRDPVRLEVAFGATARRVGGVAGAERYVRSGRVGVAVPVVYQRADGSAHVIAAVRVGDGDGVDLLDAQKGEVAEAVDVLAAVGVWVIPVSGVEVDGEVVLPLSGSGLRREGWGAGLPAEVTGPKRRRGVSGPVAGGADASAGSSRGEAGQGSREEEVGESSGGVKRRKVDAAAAVEAVSGSPGDGGSEVLTPTEQAVQQDPNAERKRKQKERDAKRSRARKAVAARVAVLEALAERGPLTVEEAVELAELQPKVAQWQKQKEGLADWHRSRKAEADRVAVLEALAERGPLTVEQEAELAELQTKVAQRKQKQKERNAKHYRSRKAAVDRVAVLEELAERRPLTVEEEAELAELQTKAQQWQKQKENKAKYHLEGRAAADRVAVLEALAERGPLTVEQEAELAELQPKAQRKQKQKERNAKHYRSRKAAVDRVAVLEALAERGPLTVEQEAELAELQTKVAQRKQKQKERNTEYRREGRAAVDRVAVLETLKEQGPLTEEQEAELAELQTKAQQWQKQKERNTEYRREGRAAVDRVAVLEALKERGPLTEELAVELAELRSKVVGRGRKKQDREVTETGVGGALVADRGAALEEMSGWAGVDQDELDRWSADVDLGGWRAQAVADVDGMQVPQGAADAGVMLGGGADGEFVATELPAFLGPDAVDDAAVAGGFDFAGFLPDYGEGVGSVGLFGGEGADGLFFGEPFAGDAVGPDAVGSGVWGVSGPVAGGELVGVGYWFLRGVNQANYGSGDERYQVNCLDAVVALHNSVKFGRQFVAGPAGGDRDPARLEVAFGATARWVAGVAGAEQYVRGGPMGVAVPVVYQRADGSAHVIAAVHAGERGEQGRVVLLDAQKGEEAETADVLAAVGVWVIPVSGVEVEGEVVLPPGGSGLRRLGWGSGLPTVVAGPKRWGGVSGPVAGKADASAGRTRGEAGPGARGGGGGGGGRLGRDLGGLSGGRWTRPLLLGLFPGVWGMAGVRCSRRRIRQHSRTRVRSGNRNRRKRTRRVTRRERLLPPVLRCWRR
ncbi:hypothetical protein A8926_6100 [Saccharopolyspora spinosa]|uniref:Uncharacterized protein n=1 Tax=Saccharopolyspora spinosa TaxID=60894 RepID=A0A2N3Y537_SACSN|nr:hypothetical protein A8926_6100 [Saccharopolyspora spinosa]